MKIKNNIFVKFIWGSIVVLVLSASIFIRGTKNKTDFETIKGRIVSLEKSNPNGKSRNEGKYRYLRIDGYPKTFVLFIGKDPGDLKPEFERIDDLKQGDIVDIYYDETFRQKNSDFNKLTQYIDKDGKSYFIRGSMDKIMGAILFSAGILLLLFSVYLKKVGKIR